MLNEGKGKEKEKEGAELLVPVASTDFTTTDGIGGGYHAGL